MIEVKNYPADRHYYFEHCNKQDLYRMPYHGYFEEPLKSHPDKKYISYIPESAYLSTPAVVIINDTNDPEWLAESGWPKTADEHGFIIFQIDADSTQEELFDFIKDDVRGRTYTDVNKNYLYLVGYGKGASIAQRLAMYKTPEIAGLVLIAESYDIQEEELKKMDTVESFVPGVPMSQVSMPVWMISDGLVAIQERILDYWKKANRSQEAPYKKDGSLWYLPKENTIDSLIEEVVGGKVRVSPVKDTNSDAIWTFLSEYFRPVGIGNHRLCIWRQPEEDGFTFHTMDIDGYRREWYQYIPSCVAKNPTKKVPLVFSFHGGSNTNRAFLPGTEWVKVAEARGFIVVFPTAALRSFEKNNQIPHPAWNANHNNIMLDDEKFVRELVKSLVAQYPIDEKRIYSSGHSMGSAFGQRALLAMPDIFCAAGVTSGVLRGGFFGDYETPGIDETHKRPIWIIMGEKDIGGGSTENNPDMANNMAYWTKRNEAHTELAHNTGVYHTRVFVNAQGVPMLQLTTVDNKPHCPTPQDSWFLYDEWFSKFSMDEEGNTVYMGGICVK